MAPPDRKTAREFDVETRFQTLARRPGGPSREDALRAAEAQIDTVKPHFTGWLNQELDALLNIIPDREVPAPTDPAWIDAARHHLRRLADVAVTMDHEFVSFVAENLCEIFEAGEGHGKHYAEAVACHIDALRLARRHRTHAASEHDMQKLRDGLRRVLASKIKPPRIDDKVTIDTL